jgi:hypothetical protein
MKWEYTVLRLNAATEPTHLDDAMNNVGEVGWELVGITHHVGDDPYYTAVFKRLKT